MKRYKMPGPSCLKEESGFLLNCYQMHEIFPANVLNLPYRHPSAELAFVWVCSGLVLPSRILFAAQNEFIYGLLRGLAGSLLCW